jgi:hypothetical protein
MMVVGPKKVVALTSEEEEKNCCVDGPIIALLNYKETRQQFKNL